MRKIKEEIKEENDGNFDLKKLEAKFKSLGIPEACMVTGDRFDEPVEFYPTGIVEIDSILGEGMGIPEGTLIELCGEPSSGKTHVALKIVAEAQKKGQRAAYMNVENSFWAPRARALGVDTNDPQKFIMWKGIETAEQWGELIKEYARSGAYKIIVVDSITAFIPQVEFNKELNDNSKIGAHAQFMGRLTKSLIQICATSKTIVVLINQFRMGAGVRPMEMVKTPTGGASVGYLVSMRMWFTKINGALGEVIGENEEKIGNKSKIYMAKTRFAEADQTAIFPIYYAEGKANPLGEFLFLAQSKGKEFIKVLRKRYMYVDKTTGEILAKDLDPIIFVKELMSIPPPDDKAKKDTSENVFDYICNKLKYNEAQRNAVLESLEKEQVNFATPEDLSDVDED